MSMVFEFGKYTNNCHSGDESPKNRRGGECNRKSWRFFASHCSVHNDDINLDCHCERVKRAWQSICNIFYGLLRHFVPRNDGKLAAFTLAEVLITLTIIGVIAALTIPNLMRKWEDVQTVSGVKEAYSILNQAVKQAVRDNGEFEDWGWPDITTASYSSVNMEYFLEKISPYLKIKCTYKDAECPFKKYPYNQTYNFYRGLSGVKLYSPAKASAFQLNNGMFAGLDIKSPAEFYWKVSRNSYGTGESIGSITVDINGIKGPNRHGYDIFTFALVMHPSRLEPFYFKIRSKGELYSCGDWSYSNCSYWIFKLGNVDYKYKDMSTEL